MNLRIKIQRTEDNQRLEIDDGNSIFRRHYVTHKYWHESKNVRCKRIRRSNELELMDFVP